MEEIEAWIKEQQGVVDKALLDFLPCQNSSPKTIHEAMHYSVFAGGKRLRPLLCLAAVTACSGDLKQALAPACAVEVLHTYSLIHDDLPCMDDDDLRRGRPTSHKVYGEGIAVLAGDALLTEAFIMISKTPEVEHFSMKDYVFELASAGGSQKLIGGQVLDLEGEGQALSKLQLTEIHEAKTAALLTSSLVLGGMVSNASQTQIEALRQFGRHLGLAFQVIDDILDVTQSTEVLGKTAGKDEVVQKVTYPSIMGLEASKVEAEELTTKALDALLPFGDNAQCLRSLAKYMLNRNF